MTTNDRVLIIEDEPIAADGYANVLCHLQSQAPNLDFLIEKAHTFETARTALGHPFHTKMDRDIIFDLVFLDIRLPRDTFGSQNLGIELGMMVRTLMPDAKIMVITNVDAPSLLRSIMDDISPEAFLIKCDIDTMSLVDAIEKVLRHERVTSKRVATFLQHQYHHGQFLDRLDTQLLQEIVNGAKMKELTELLPLTKSGIEKRRTQVKEKFGDRHMSDRAMILLAKDAALPKKLITSYHKEISFKQEMRGSADIITEDLRLIERFFYQFKNVFKR